MATVTFHDQSGLSLSPEKIQLKQILDVAELPHGKIAVILHHGQVEIEAMGICIGSRLARWYQGGVEFDDLAPGWDCGVALSKKTCERFGRLPAFFTYVLGHELGHAVNYLTDPETFILGDLIRRHIRNASQEAIMLEQELPHEAACDEFGIMIAEQLFPKKQIAREIYSRMKDDDCNDPKRLQFLLKLSGSRRVYNLKTDLIRFALPYKDALISSWRDKAIRDKESVEAICIDDPEDCFRLP